MVNMKRVYEDGWGEEGETQEGGRVQLRNINNLSELSIGDSHCEEHSLPSAHLPPFRRKMQ